VRRRVQIQADDVGRLLLEVRIVRGHLALDAMGLQTVLAPHARSHHVADIQMSGELACGPMRRATRCVARALQNPRFQLRGEYAIHLPDMPAVESRDVSAVKQNSPGGGRMAFTYTRARNTGAASSVGAFGPLPTEGLAYVFGLLHNRVARRLPLRHYKTCVVRHRGGPVQGTHGVVDAHLPAGLRAPTSLPSYDYCCG
jgi:hypothetical protein